MSRRSDAQLVALICAELDRQAATASPGLQARLDQIREHALRQSSVTRSTTEQALAEAARQTLNRNGEPGPDVTTRLDQIRGAALARMPDGTAATRTGTRSRLLQASRQALQGWRFPAGMVATGLVLVTAVTLLRSGTSVESLTAEQELALLASVEDIELYENLEFYLWLADSEFATQ